MSLKKTEIETKKLFTQLHGDQLKNQQIFGRLKNLLSTKFFYGSGMPCIFAKKIMKKKSFYNCRSRCKS